MEMDNAINKYEQILEIDCGNSEAKRMLKSLKEMKIIQEIQGEIQKLQMSGEHEMADEKLCQLYEMEFESPIIKAMVVQMKTMHKTIKSGNERKK